VNDSAVQFFNCVFDKRSYFDPLSPPGRRAVPLHCEFKNEPMQVLLVNTQLQLGGAETVVRQLLSRIPNTRLLVVEAPLGPVEVMYPRWLSRLNHSRFHSLVERRFPTFSASSYLRRLGLAMPVESTIDQHAILDLVKINADLGRFGGLIKMWLTTNANFQSLGAQGLQRKLESTLSDVRLLQKKMSDRLEDL
jgi:hypothetical protein